MPALTTHCLYGDKMVLSSDSDYLIKIINRNKQIFHIGCQGPDLFFFYHRIPYLQSNGKEINGIGGTLHLQYTNKLFKSLLLQTYQNKDEKMIAYLCGFIAHHALDSFVHPYIYYRTESAVVKTGCQHLAFEGDLDCGVLTHHKIGFDQYRCDKLIKHKKVDREIVATLVVKMVKDVLDKDIDRKIILDCCKEMVTIEKVLYDPKGKKYQIFEKIEQLTHTEGLATSMLIPVKYKDDLDCMNYRKETWLHPCTKEKSNEDFTDLASKAIVSCVEIYALVDKYLHDKASIDDVLAVINDRSFSTNLPGLVEMKYFAYDLK